MSSSNVPAAGRYDIDPAHTSLEFVARHMVSKVKGRFGEFAGTIEVGEDQAHSVDVSIVAASIDTRETKRDEHLRGADFLDVDNHKELTFKSTGVEQGGDKHKLRGDLTIKDVT